jgi:hypothetical protein
MIVQYFDELISDIDLLSEKELQLRPDVEQEAVKINQRREVFLGECKNAQAACLSHLDQELAADLHLLEELDEHTLNEKLFKVFCFLIYVLDTHHLITTDTYLSNEQLTCFKFLLKNNHYNIGTAALTNSVGNPFQKLENTQGTIIEVWLNLVESCLLKDLVIRADLARLVKINRLEISQPIEIKPFARILFQDIQELFIEFYNYNTLGDYAKQINTFKQCQLPGKDNKTQIKLEGSIDLSSLHENEDEESFEFSKFLEPLSAFNMNMLIIYAKRNPDRIIQFNELNADSFSKNWENLLTLMLKNFHLKRIGPRTFSNFKSLNYLNLTDANLSEVDAEAFDGLAHLENLDLSDNLIQAFADGTFDSLVRLRRFNLCDNKLVKLQDNLFAKLIKLECLSLNRNPITEPFQEDTFSGLNSLKILDLKEVPVAKNLDAESLVFKKHLTNINEFKF